MDNFIVTLSKWKYHLIVILIVMIVIRLIIKHQATELRSDSTCEPERAPADGNGSLFYLGRGSEDDTIETLLKRTSWVAYLSKRTSHWQRIFITTFVIMFMYTLICSFKGDRWELPALNHLLITWVIIYFVLFFSRDFYYVHGDIMADFTVRNNVKLIASKLNLDVDFSSDPPKPTNGPPDRVLVMT